MIFEIRENLIKLSENEYKKFNEKLIPSCENILGVRTPALKEIAKKIVQSEKWEEYVLYENMKYHEEFLLQGMVIGFQKAEFEKKIVLIEKFVPRIKNWAVCDNFCTVLKISKKDREKLWNFLERYFLSMKEYEIRFAVIMCLKNFINEEYLFKVFKRIDTLEERKDYYVQMGIAWTIAEAFIKYPEKTLEYLRENNLDDFTFNKAIQKICESFRVEKEMKKYLKTLKR